MRKSWTARFAIPFLAVVLVPFLLGADNSCSGSSSEGHSRIRLVRSGSWCAAHPLVAQIVVFVTLRNTGNASGTVEVLPHRRYNDGTTNASTVDVFDVKVPAHGTKRVFSKYDYNALSHNLIGCSIDLGFSGNAIPVEVR